MQLLLNYLNAGITDTKDKSTLVKIQFLNGLFAIAVMIIFAYGVANIVTKNIWLAQIAVVLMASCAYAIYSMRRTHNITVASIVALIVLLFSGVNSFLFPGEQQMGLVWMFLLPVTAFLISEGRSGLIWLAMYFATLFGMYAWHLFGMLDLPYEPLTVLTVFLALLTVSMVVFMYQMLKERAEDSSAQQESELEKFQEAVENSTQQIIFTNAKGIVEYVNKASEEVTGYARNELIGKQQKIWGAQMPKEFKQEIMSTLATDKQPFQADVLNRRKNGELYDATIQIFPIFDAHGKVKFFVTIEEDNTKKKEVERMKSDFVSVASHQLRTPLTGIKWFINLLLQKKAGALTPKQHEYLTKMYESNERMIELVMDLLEVSRIEATQKVQLNKKPTDISKLIDLEVKAQMLTADQQDITIITKDIPKKLILPIDKEKIIQVFRNLLDNAIKYSPEGGKIVVGCRKENGEYVFFVHDNGLGIPTSQHDQVFSRFFRGRNVLKKQIIGTGLGLYIVKTIMEEHGGHIWFESKENEGTTFFISLPAHKRHKK
jgi:PAS domain S-box-containing protein